MSQHSIEIRYNVIDHANHSLYINSTIAKLINLKPLLFFPAERRPLKSTVPIPLFRSPTAHLVPNDIMEDDREFLSDGLNLSYTASSFEPTTMQYPSSSNSNDVLHHYSFLQPNKQIVSVCLDY